MELNDSLGFPIKEGHELERVIARRAGLVGHKYKVEKRKWDDTDKTESLVANGDFISTQLNEERAKEFRIVV